VRSDARSSARRPYLAAADTDLSVDVAGTHHLETHYADKAVGKERLRLHSDNGLLYQSHNPKD